MNVVLAFASVDGLDAAARLTALLTTLGVAVVEPGPDAASAPVIALLTPAALRDARVLRHLGGPRGAGQPALLPLAAPAPADFPAPADLARIIEWLHAPAAGSKYRIHIGQATNTIIGDNGMMVNVFGAGGSAVETAHLVTALRAAQQPGAPMSAAELRGLLAQVQAQVQQVDATLRQGFGAVLMRFDLSEQRIIGPILARLDAQHAAEVAALLDLLDAATLTHDELAYWLAPVSAALLEFKQEAAHIQDQPLLASVRQTADLIEAPGLDVKHKLKLTIPIIPLLLDYEGEFEFNTKMNLESAWQAPKRLVTRR